MSDTDPIIVKWYIHTGYSGASYEDEWEIDRTEWNGMTEAQRIELLEDMREEAVSEHIESGWQVENASTNQTS